ncbi:cytochrome c [Polaromonas sp. A23]|uniref:cytochrome c n=1 Tax=Polaromonas sp. A23 TaxID=1944133 RepID=UPI000984A782|nr:cytochrome c [Polaromonas sp. A23]OOG38507.1 alcohol dehydrogenase [Polaromonas sp. A23]
MKPHTRLKRWSIGGLAVAMALAALVAWLNLRDEPDLSSPAAAAETSPAQIQRGAYLARAGNCMSCHTARGGTPYAGGRGIDTPFGTVFSGNLTPDKNTGIGSWTASEFWRAMHNGRSRDGRLLYPAFPYTNYTEVTREDSDALYAYLQSLPPAAQANTAHTLRWPFSTQAALAVWRALYFSPGQFTPDTRRATEWNRGAYLVRGLGHCSACHSARNALGASSTPLDLAGGLIPMQNWYAPSLTSVAEAGVADWAPEHIAALLKTGVSPRGSVLGPMAEVVLHSTQHMSDADLSAMAIFLKSLPPTPTALVKSTATGNTAVAQAGGKLYEQHCVQCHGDQGRGIPGAYPPLAGNRAVTMDSTANLVQVVLNGGYAPATAGNPRPFGMPPLVLVLDDTELAALLTYLRGAWGNQASAVTAAEVNRMRAANNR